jgi:hypothetical protein
MKGNGAKGVKLDFQSEAVAKHREHIKQVIMQRYGGGSVATKQSFLTNLKGVAKRKGVSE